MTVTIDAGIGTIKASIDNLQLVQLMEALKDKIEKDGPLQVLKMLSL